MDKRIIYADNAATTKISEKALAAMLPWYTENFGNPSSIYGRARTARRGIEAARETVAKALGAAKPNEIYFTSGGTESDDWAIKGAAALQTTKKHIVISGIEHHAISETAHSLERFGFEVTELPVDSYGLVSVESLEKAMRPDTFLVSIMLANNEIGTIQPIKELCAAAKAHGALFHTDAVQAVGHIPVDVQDLGVDMLSLSSHKFHGPQGIGAMYIRSGVRIANLIDGGGQERRRRSGTENVAAIVGMATALEEQTSDWSRLPKLEALRDRLIKGLLEIPYTQQTGHPTKRLPTNASVVINGIEGEGIILGLDNCGIQASSGSACTSGSLDPSHVLLGIGLEHAVAHGSLRLSFGEETTEEDIDYIIASTKQVVERLRSMSPVWDSVNNKPLK